MALARRSQSSTAHARTRKAKLRNLPRSQFDPSSRPLWGVGDMAAYLRKSRHAIYKMVSRRQVPFLKINQAVRFDPGAVQAWARRHAVPTAVPAIQQRWTR